MERYCAWQISCDEEILLLKIKVISRSPVPEREIKRTNGNKTAPLRIPTQIGCAMAVDRDFFYEIGAFDADMDIWGGENLEMSLRVISLFREKSLDSSDINKNVCFMFHKVWQCGGTLLLIPCSHIGHLFRIAAYSFGGNKELVKDRNNVRILEMWMDEYKKLYYSIFPSKIFHKS